MNGLRRDGYGFCAETETMEYPSVSTVNLTLKTLAEHQKNSLQDAGKQPLSKIQAPFVQQRGS
jgi:hypothetical protein